MIKLIFSRLKQFVRDRAATTAVTFALAAVPLIAGAGIAVDYARAIKFHTELQVGADAAALGAALINGATDEERIAAAKVIFNSNLDKGVAVPVVNVTVGSDEVRVAATTNLKSTLMNVVGYSKNRLTVSATAAYGSRPGPCILTLDTSVKNALLINSDANIIAPDCAVQVNSSNSEALRGNSNGNISAKEICVNGNWVSDSNSQFNPTPEKCDPVSDPLAALPPPPEAGNACDWTDLTVEGIVTLYPGVYCKKLELNSGANVIFSPGIYVIRDGEFIVNSHSTATAKGVMFYLTGTTNNPRFNINSNSHIEFSAPTSGTYAGIVFFQARDAVADFSILNSDSSSIVEGTIYLPNSPLHLNSNGNISESSPWTAIIVKTLELNSNSILHINADYASSSVPVPVALAGGSGRNNVWLKR